MSGSRLRVLVLPLLAGCATPAAEQEALAAALLENSRASLVALSPAAPSSDAAPDLTRPRRAPSPHPRPAETGPTGSRPASAAQLLGAVPETLRRWLGEPNLRRPEGPAEIWLYTAEDCALDIILYREGGSLRVANAAARASGARSQTEAACLHQLSAAAGRPQPSAGIPVSAIQRKPGA
jgi:hypothetical protein